MSALQNDAKYCFTFSKLVLIKSFGIVTHTEIFQLKIFYCLVRCRKSYQVHMNVRGKFVQKNFTNMFFPRDDWFRFWNRNSSLEVDCTKGIETEIEKRAGWHHFKEIMNVFQRFKNWKLIIVKERVNKVFGTNWQIHQMLLSCDDYILLRTSPQQKWRIIMKSENQKSFFL